MLVCYLEFCSVCMRMDFGMVFKLVPNLLVNINRAINIFTGYTKMAFGTARNILLKHVSRFQFLNVGVCSFSSLEVNVLRVQTESLVVHF